MLTNLISCKIFIYVHTKIVYTTSLEQSVEDGTIKPLQILSLIHVPKLVMKNMYTLNQCKNIKSKFYQLKNTLFQVHSEFQFRRDVANRTVEDDKQVIQSYTFNSLNMTFHHSL